jgi:uncharacterized protein (TIGR03083 family)
MTGSQHPRELLTRAAAVMSASLECASQVMPTRPTPCTEWDLGTLVHHVAHSASALAELIEGTEPGSAPKGGCTNALLQIRRLLEAIARTQRHRSSLELTALTGAFELTLHAWDIKQSTGDVDPLPADLVSTLLSFVPVVLNNVPRSGLFATSLPPSAEQATDTDRFLALFGRRHGGIGR